MLKTLFTRALPAFAATFLSLALSPAQQTPANATPLSIPRLIQFSGQLKGAAEAPAIGVTFSLYKNQEGGAPVWMETQNISVDAAGRYVALLGSRSNEGLPLDLFTSGEARWLGIRIQGSAEEQPRILLVSVPYALKAHDAETLGGRPAADFVLSEAAAPSLPDGPSRQSAGSQADSRPAAARAGTAAVTNDGPTNFTGTTSSQVVKVTQNGTGAGLIAVTPSTVFPAIEATNKSASAAVAAISGTAMSTAGTGVYGDAPALTGATTGVLGTSESSVGTGVVGLAGNSAGNTVGVRGTVASPTGVAIQAVNTTAGGPAGSFQGTVVITSDGNQGSEATLTATNTATTGSTNAIVGQTSNPAAIAIVGINTNPGGQAGNFQGTVAVASNGNTGVDAALSVTNTATSGSGGNGIVGQTSNPGANAVVGINTNPGAPAGNFAGTVTVTSDGNTAADAALSVTNTVTSGGAGNGIVGQTSNPAANAIIGINTGAGGGAGYFQGGVAVIGNLRVTGQVSKGSGSFQIDHPLDPANKYLSHSFVESPDMMNVYNGNVVTDKRGLATVTLPDYFESLNGDFRYQLTVIGRFAQAIVSEKIADNRFVIRTSKPSVEVSWQVTGIRRDAYARAYPIRVEEDKADFERGYYLHPEVFGQPAAKNILAVRKPASQQLASASHQ